MLGINWLTYYSNTYFHFNCLEEWLYTKKLTVKQLEKEWCFQDFFSFYHQGQEKKKKKIVCMRESSVKLSSYFWAQRNDKNKKKDF